LPELGVTIVKGVLSRDHVHLLVSIPPKRSVSEVAVHDGTLVAQRPAPVYC
jgi:REP element-mobilizing transposase RayT